MRTKTASLAGALTTAVLVLSACGGDAGSATGSGSGSGSEGGESRTLKLALNQTEEHPSFIALDAFGQRLEEATDGRWSIEVYPNETLGAQAEAMQLVSSGSVDMAIVSGTQLENLNDDFLVFNLPTVFDSVEQQMSVVNDLDVVGDLYSSLESSENITVVGGFTQGTRSVYTTDGPVKTPEDLAGKKMRVQESDVHLSMMEAMGGSPTPLAFGEVYTALQSGVIDGAENNEVSYFTQKHHEVSPFYSRTNHLVGLDYLIINTGLLAEMSEEDRAAFDEEWTATHEEHTQLWTEATEKAIADAEAAGATFSEVDADAFAEVLEPLIDKFLTTDSQRALYDAARSN
jgi:tripartite ATP-independent transporter DctP family solute receptor